MKFKEAPECGLLFSGLLGGPRRWSWLAPQRVQLLLKVMSAFGLNLASCCFPSCELEQCEGLKLIFTQQCTILCLVCLSYVFGYSCLKPWVVQLKWSLFLFATIYRCIYPHVFFWFFPPSFSRSLFLSFPVMFLLPTLGRSGFPFIKTNGKLGTI